MGEIVDLDEYRHQRIMKELLESYETLEVLQDMKYMVIDLSEIDDDE